MLPDVPITNASVLVAFATIGGVPNNSSVGKVTSVPPPATALIAPPAPAASTNPKISVSDIVGCGPLEIPPHRGAYLVIGHDLRSRVINAHRHIHSQQGTELLRPGEIDLRPHVHDRQCRMSIRDARIRIIPAVITGDNRL